MLHNQNTFPSHRTPKGTLVSMAYRRRNGKSRYTIDGCGIYTLLDKNKKKPTNLDECGGHSDDIRGYHYHAGESGGN